MSGMWTLDWMVGCRGAMWGAPVEGVRKNPPFRRPCCMFTQSSPRCVVQKWFGANHHMFTPLLVADFHFCQKRSVFPDFPAPPSCWKGGCSTLFAPFVRPLCTPLSTLEPPF